MLDRIRISLGIRGRLILWFVLGAVGAVVFGSIVVYASGLASIQGTLGQTYCQIASRAVGQFEGHFFSESAVVQNIATDVLTTEVLLDETEVYYKRTPDWIGARLNRQAREWAAAVKESKRKSILHRQLSHRLTVLAGLGDSLRRLAVYDSVGVLHAANLPPAQRVAAGHPWFKSVDGQGSHFVYSDLDAAAGVLTIVIPVWGGVEIVGYVLAEYDYAGFSRGLGEIRFGATGEAMLVNAGGMPLGGKSRAFLGATLMRAVPSENVSKKGGASGGDAYWVALPDDTGWAFWRRLACVASMPRINALRNRFGLLPWTVVVTQSPDESYVTLRKSLGSFTVAGLIGIVVVGLGGAFLAWHITTPLKELQSGVRRFARGERERLVEVASTDEIGELAEEFNRMAVRVTASENELRAFAQAVENATDAIIMTDPKGVIYYANPAFETVTGYAAADVRGETPGFLRAAETPPELYREMWRTVTQGRAWRGELWNERRNGEVYPIDLTISPIRDEQGAVVSLLGVHRDITLARNYQESLEKEVEARTREIAETQGLTVMGRLASMIAHDLRNALSTVKMNLQILFRRHGDTGDIAREHCQIGLDQVRYMEDIVSDMLSYARPEKLRADWHDVTSIIDEALVADAHKLEAKGAKVRRDDDAGLPEAYCDRIKVIEVVRNLIDNSLQALPEGGELGVAVTGDRQSDGSFVRITIRDSGEGIPEDVLGSIFEPFFTTRSKGTGLGLAIVKRIIDQHGGTIDIQSEEAKGTSITFTLPIVPEKT